MDNSRFDALARFLVGGLSRRAALGLLAALGLGGLDFAVAKKKHHKKKKKPCAKTCNGCCAGKSCKAGTSAAACGIGGVGCKACAAGEGCQDGSCVTLPCGQGGACLVFVTSVTDNGNLGDGLSDADVTCQQLANNALPNSLPGTYKAWLSAGPATPANRFVQSTGPYRLVNGTTIANNWSDLIDSALLAPINFTENGGAVADPVRVWTGTAPNSLSGGLNCSGWSSSSNGETGVFGIATASNGAWTQSQDDICSLQARLYCFQQS